MPVMFYPVIRVWYLPFDCPEHEDSNGWLAAEFRTVDEAYAWAADNDGLIECAEFFGNGFRFVDNGCIIREE